VGQENLNKDYRYQGGVTPSMLRVLDLLGKHTPLSPKEIAQEAFVALTTLEGGGYLKKLKALGLIHIDGWLKNHNGFTTPLYGLGTGKDCVRPKFRSMDHDSPGMARIVSVIRQRDGLTYLEIARLAGISANTIKNAGYMKSLVKQKRIHVSAWRRSSKGHLCPVYSFGEGDCVQKPSSLTRAEIMRRHRTRRRGTTSGSLSVSAQLKYNSSHLAQTT
jgi:DNA-binding CsgD family transcriptional regulator